MMKKQGGRGFARVVTAVLVLAASANGHAQIAVPGQFSVSASGSATYSIPIAVPPGIAGMQPKISLAYDSQGGNDLLGVGWSLSGLSNIVRCPRTLLQDGVRGTVNFDGNDRYCLDGQRLIAVSGANGGNGTEYRAEQEAFSRIISYSETGATNGPGSFIVKTKSGSTIEFGKTEDSRIEAKGKLDGTGHGPVLYWAINKISDAKGNYCKFTYTEDQANGQFYPAEMKCVNALGASAGYRVVFDYESRSDVVPTYQAGGGKVKLNVRLSAIRVLADSGALIGKHALAYDTDPLTGQSHIKSVSYAGAANALPAVNFERAPSVTPALTQALFESRGGGYWDTQKWFVEDMNGDGLPDMVNVFGANGLAAIDVHINTGTGFAVQHWEAPTGGYWDSQKWFIADVNGDGLPDLVNVFGANSQAAVDVHINTGSSFVMQHWESPSSGYWDSQRWFVADMNGDGLPDLVNLFGSNGLSTVDVHINTGSAFVRQNWEAPSGGYWDTQKWFIADVNGDGLPDMVNVFGSNGSSVVDVHLNTGSSLVMQHWEAASGGYWDSQQWFVADMNGDGLPDLVNLFGSNGLSTVDVHVNTGSSFVMQNWQPPTGGYWDTQKWFIADMNGDGLPDLVNVFGSNGLSTVNVHINNGSSLSMQQWKPPAGGFWDGQRWFTADVNGDGAMDLLNLFNENGYSSIEVHKSNVLNGAVNKISSLGTSKSITYAKPAQQFGTRYIANLTRGYPRVLTTPTMSLVTDVNASNGIGGTNTTSYSYANYVTELGASGRGALGFQWMQTKDVSTSLVSRTYYRQDFPYIGMVDKVGRGTTEANWSNLSLATNEYSFKAFVATDTGYASPVSCTDTQSDLATCKANAIKPGNRYTAYPSKVVEKNWDWNDQSNVFTALPQKRTTTVVNNWADPTQIKVEVLDTNGGVTGFSKTTDTVYSTPDVTNWKLGRVIKSSVTAVSP